MKMAQLYRESKPVNRKSGSSRKAAFPPHAARRSPCASRIRVFKPFTSHESRATACKVFTRHGSRNMIFPCPPGDSKKSNPKPGQPVFHESRNTRHETRLFQTRNTAFPWLAWYLLVLKPFSLVFSAGMCSGLRVMTPLLGTKTSSTPVGDVGDDKAAQATFFRYLRDRDPSHGFSLARRKPARIPRFSRNTRNETRNTAFFRPETRLRGSLGTCWY